MLANHRPTHSGAGFAGFAPSPGVSALRLQSVRHSRPPARPHAMARSACCRSWPATASPDHHLPAALRLPGRCAPAQLRVTQLRLEQLAGIALASCRCLWPMQLSRCRGRVVPCSSTDPHAWTAALVAPGAPPSRVRLRPQPSPGPFASLQAAAWGPSP